MHDELFDRVKALVAELRGDDPRRLRPDTTLGEDLGIDGDDGIDFMTAFGERFNVDLSAFRPDQYFGPEAGPNPLFFLYDVYHKLRYGRERWPMLQITLDQLCRAAEAGRWADPRVDAA